MLIFLVLDGRLLRDGLRMRSVFLLVVFVRPSGAHFIYLCFRSCWLRLPSFQSSIAMAFSSSTSVTIISAVYFFQFFLVHVLLSCAYTLACLIPSLFLLSPLPPLSSLPNKPFTRFLTSSSSPSSSSYHTTNLKHVHI